MLKFYIQNSKVYNIYFFSYMYLVSTTSLNVNIAYVLSATQADEAYMHELMFVSCNLTLYIGWARVVFVHPVFLDAQNFDRTVLFS